MKFKRLQARSGIKAQQPYIAFTVPGKEYDRINGYHGKDLRGSVVDVYKPKRSTQANAYMWALIQEIAEKIDLPAVEIYKQAVKEAGKGDVDRRSIIGAGDIRTLGTYPIQIRLHEDVLAETRVSVIPAPKK